MLYLVTSSNSKFKSAKEALAPFKITIKQKYLNIIEPQAASSIEVAKSKATQAFKILKQPILVMDSGVNIPSLTGFPGPFMHYLSEWFRVDDWLNLMRGKTDRRISFENVLIYKDKDCEKLFKIDRKGVILKNPKGKGKIAIDSIMTFRKDKKTVAECETEGISRFDIEETESLWVKFGRWYKSSKILKM